MNIEVKEIVNTKNENNMKEEKSDVVKLPELIQEEPELDSEELDTNMEPEFDEEPINQIPCKHKLFGDIKQKNIETTTKSGGSSTLTNTLFILMGVGLLSKIF